MRIVIDAMGSPAGSGGMHLYARELVTAWADTHPDDALTVIAGPWAADAFAAHANVSVHVVPSVSATARAWTQLVSSALVYRRSRAEALLSLSPIASPLVPAARRTVVVHDWRHESRPTEFPLVQRLYRRLWRWSAGAAGTTIAISEKTAAETRRRARPRHLVVVENGGDHPRRWVAAPTRDGGTNLVTYGHLPNKRPEAVIRAIAAMPDLTLWVLGAHGSYRESLRELAASYRVAHRVRLPGYVSDRSYQRIVASASAIVLNSSDEGFGLPVVEAAYFGIPVVVASDSGLAAIHGPDVHVSDPDPQSIADAVTAALREAPRHPRPVRPWALCAHETRAAVDAALPRTSRAPAVAGSRA